MKLSELCLEAVSENKKLLQKMISKKADEATPYNQNDDPEFHKKLAQQVGKTRSEVHKMSPSEVKAKIRNLAKTDVKYTKVDDMARKHLKE
jgi:hypothetical protein